MCVQDREAHMHDYPALSYPHVFVLQVGGGGGGLSQQQAQQSVVKCETRGSPTKPCVHALLHQRAQACHNAVKRAWAKTTRTYARGQRQRRPSYRLRQSFGAAGGGRPSADGRASLE